MAHALRGPDRRDDAGDTQGMMMTCDYNGWNDAPEDEREWFDQHPEIWGDPAPEPRHRFLRAPRRPPDGRSRGGMAA